MAAEQTRSHICAANSLDIDASLMQRSPACLSSAACKHIWRATSTSVAISASMKAMAWCSISLAPNVSRSRA